MESSISHESYERNIENMIRKYGNSVNRNSFEAIRQDYAEKNALYDKKEAEILDPLKPETHKMGDRLDATKAVHALAEKQSENEIAKKQLENKIAEKRKVPPRKRGKGKSHLAPVCSTLR